MRIRPYRPADQNAVIRLWTDCGLVVAHNDPVRDIERKLRVNPEWFLVGEKDGTIIASCMVGYEGHRGWINYLAVAPGEQRNGHASAMMREAERILLAAGCPKINLQIRAANREVIQFYESIGYTQDHVVSLGKRLIPDVEQIHGDRNVDLGLLAGRSWDAVVDTCGYLPRVVRASAAALRDSCGHYTFISSISVYSAPVPRGANEQAPLAMIEDDRVDEFAPERYGPLKACCEQAVAQRFPGKSLIVRSGLLVGPNDPTGRLSYWTRRIVEGAEVLAPGSPSRSVQLIHARDMAEWILDMAARRAGGTYNVTGPVRPLDMGTLLNRIRDLTGRGTVFTWVPEDFLVERDVKPWTELPLWVPESLNGMLDASIQRARDSGLSTRPLDEILAEALELDALETPQSAALASGASTTSVLSRQREKEILQQWHASGLSRRGD